MTCIACLNNSKYIYDMKYFISDFKLCNISLNSGLAVIFLEQYHKKISYMYTQLVENSMISAMIGGPRGVPVMGWKSTY
jgi:hypothetical protein